tara:strand:+ start:66548 stop:66937 length:390 start_codon:yes stop_codon:yes gene_type:complete
MAKIEGNTTQALLMQMRDLISQANNGRPCVGYETLAVTNSTVVRLTVPSAAQSAEITVESAGSTDANKAVRYTTDNSTTPVTGATSSGAGVPLGDFDTVEILNHQNLNAFRVIAVDAANTKYLKVQYFK